MAQKQTIGVGTGSVHIGHQPPGAPDILFEMAVGGECGHLSPVQLSEVTQGVLTALTASKLSAYLPYLAGDTVCGNDGYLRLGIWVNPDSTWTDSQLDGALAALPTIDDVIRFQVSLGAIQNLLINYWHSNTSFVSQLTSQVNNLCEALCATSVFPEGFPDVGAGGDGHSLQYSLDFFPTGIVGAFTSGGPAASISAQDEFLITTDFAKYPSGIQVTSKATINVNCGFGGSIAFSPPFSIGSMLVASLPLKATVPGGPTFSYFFTSVTVDFYSGLTLGGTLSSL